MRLSYPLFGLVVFMFVGLPSIALELGEAVGPVPLRGLEGVERVMDNYGERRGTVVVFLSARCPVTSSQIAEISETYERYRLRDVLFVGIASKPDEDGTSLKTFTQSRGLRFPVYLDPEAGAAAQFGAARTPEFFLLDEAGKLLYHGGLHGAGGKGSLDAAIQALLGGTPVSVPQTDAPGMPLQVPGELQDQTNPYGSMRFFSSFVFDDLPGVPVHHCSTLAEAPNGDILCLWYGGSYESADDQALYLARLPKGARRWEAPERMLWNPEQPPGNAVIFRTPDNKVGVLWGRMEQSRPMRRGHGLEPVPPALPDLQRQRPHLERGHGDSRHLRHHAAECPPHLERRPARNTHQRGNRRKAGAPSCSISARTARPGRAAASRMAGASPRSSSGTMAICWRSCDASPASRRRSRRTTASHGELQREQRSRIPGPASP